MTKKVTKNHTPVRQIATRKKIYIPVLSVAVLGLVAYLWIAFLLPYHRAAKLAEIAPMRDLILSAINNLHVQSPVDPKTGDYYFPEAKLYLPASSSLSQKYLYVFNEGSDDQAISDELSITTPSAIAQESAKLYAARNFEELFNAVPAVQACSRGVRLTYSTQSDDQINLVHTVELPNTKTLYIYQEKSCPQLSETADLLQSIRPY